MRGARADDELGLFGVAALHGERVDVAAGSRALRDLASVSPDETPLDRLSHDLVRDIAGGRHDHVAREVVVVEEGPDLGHRDPLDHLGVAEDFAAERVAREHRLAEQLLHHVGRLVEVHQHLLEDDLALGIDVVRPQRRLAKDVAEDVEAEIEVLRQGAHVEGRVLLRRVGVHVAADGVDRLGDVPGGTGVGPLEEQVLEEVGDAELFAGLVTRARPHPHPDGRRTRRPASTR